MADKTISTAAANLGDKSGPLELSENETRVLGLFDQLQELQFQLALAHAQKEYHQGDKPQLRFAREQLLQTKASYQLRNKVVDSVMTVNPILQAIHRGNQASPVERDLISFVEQRDALAREVATQTRVLKETVDHLAQVEVENLRIGGQNVQLGAEVTRLARDASETIGTVAVGDTRLKAEVSQLESELRENKRMWKMAKEATSAVIVASGVDWARDQHLQGLVLSPD